MAKKQDEWIEIPEQGYEQTEDMVNTPDEGDWQDVADGQVANDDPEIMRMQAELEQTKHEEAQVAQPEEHNGPIDKLRAKWNAYKNDKMLERKRLEGVRKTQEERLKKAKMQLKAQKMQEKYTQKITRLSQTPSQRFDELKGKMATAGAAFGGGASASGPKRDRFAEMLGSNRMGGQGFGGGRMPGLSDEKMSMFYGNRKTGATKRPSMGLRMNAFPSRGTVAAPNLERFLSPSSVRRKKKSPMGMKIPKLNLKMRF